MKKICSEEEEALKSANQAKICEAQNLGRDLNTRLEPEDLKKYALTRLGPRSEP